MAYLIQDKHQRSWLRKLLPHPFISLILFICWFLLNSISPGQLVLSLVAAISIPILCHGFLVPVRKVRWLKALKLFFIVVWDVIVGNLKVSRLILDPTLKQLHPAWFRVPLESSNPFVNTILAMIITTTPGTVSAGIDQEKRDILVHSLYSVAPENDIKEIKQRYEKALMDVFHVQSF